MHYTLFNDNDSGFSGNNWANDTIDRHLTIYQLNDGTFCVNVDDHGKFTTFAGTSPCALATPTGSRGRSR